MEAWEQEYVDQEGPGHFIFKRNGVGSFQFGTVSGKLDFRVEHIGAQPRLEFSWEGGCEMDPACGRGAAVIEAGQLHGRIFFHMGDDSSFRAIKSRSREQ